MRGGHKVAGGLEGLAKGEGEGVFDGHAARRRPRVGHCAGGHDLSPKERNGTVPQRDVGDFLQFNARNTKSNYLCMCKLTVGCPVSLLEIIIASPRRLVGCVSTLQPFGCHCPRAGSLARELLSTADRRPWQTNRSPAVGSAASTSPQLGEVFSPSPMRLAQVGVEMCQLTHSPRVSSVGPSGRWTC